jgi:hypothetical protein
MSIKYPTNLKSLHIYVPSFVTRRVSSIDIPDKLEELFTNDSAPWKSFKNFINKKIDHLSILIEHDETSGVFLEMDRNVKSYHIEAKYLPVGLKRLTIVVDGGVRIRKMTIQGRGSPLGRAFEPGEEIYNLSGDNFIVNFIFK